MRRWYSPWQPLSAKSIAWLAILTVFVISLLAVAGWLLERAPLKAIKPQWTAMRLPTAGCLILAALELAILQTGRAGPGRIILPLLISLAGLVTTVLYAIALSTGQEPSLAGVPLLDLLWAPAHRMAFLTAIFFLLSGWALALLATGRAYAAKIAHFLMLPAAMIGYLVPVSYLLGAQAMHSWLHVPVALNTGLAFCALSVAIFLVRPDTWLLRLLTGDHAGSVMVRRLLPGLLVIPFGIGWLHLHFERAGTLVEEINVALVVVAFTFALLSLVWPTAASLNRADTKRLQAENSLGECDTRFRLAFENANIGMALVGTDGRYLQVNQAMSDMFGYSRHELEKMGVRHRTHPADLQTSQDFWLRTLRGEIGSAHFVKRKLHKNGTEVWVHIASSLVRDVKGSPLYFISQIQDITARRQAEEQLRHVLAELEQRVQERTAELRDTVGQLQKEVSERHLAEERLAIERQRLFSLLENIPAHVSLLRPDHTFALVNGEFVRRFGEPGGQRCYVLLGRQTPCEGCRSLETFRTGTPATWEWTDPRGRTYQTYDYPFKDVDGSPVVLKMGVDISARKQAEKALMESEQRLHYLTSQLLSAQEKERKRISMELHEGLGQSMAALKLHLRLLQRQWRRDPDKITEEFDHAHSHLKEMIEDVRRISQNLRPLVLENLGLAVALKYLCDDFSKYEEIPVTVEMDDIHNELLPQTETNIFRIFQESLHNIAKHARATAVSVSGKKQNGQINFTIKDNGVGFNIKQPAQSKRFGKGMGLAAIEERLRMIGGRLEISSQQGQGTEIRFSILLRS